MEGDASPTKIVVAEPHGFCQGVRRAVSLADRALSARVPGAPPVYCLHELVHNRLVVDRLAARGMAFVNDLSEVPDGACVFFSAHGVSPAVRSVAAARGLEVVDATCAFVARVHELVRRFAAEGRTVVFIGRRGHDETVGIVGEAPASVKVVESVQEAESVEVPDPARVAVLTQTTLAVHQAEPVLAALRRRFPSLVQPERSSICLATTERQEAVRRLASETDLVLVLGSASSANSNRLVDVARDAGARAELLPNARAVSDFIAGGGLESVRAVGVTAGASTPEDVVDDAISRLRGECPDGR